MYISINSRNEIKSVGVSSDTSLTTVYINDDDNPFKDWSDAKICCYKVNVKDGIVMMMTPYVDSRYIEHFDQVGSATETNKVDISDNSSGIYDLAEVVSDDSVSIYELAEFISSLDERVSALEGEEEDGK